VGVTCGDTNGSECTRDPRDKCPCQFSETALDWSANSFVSSQTTFDS
jgi:hypothetical protein